MILTGWKEIARHLHCGVRTAQRRENLGLPVRRTSYGVKSPVVAESDELDFWLRHGHLPLTKTPGVLDTLQASQNLCIEVGNSRRALRQSLAAVRKQFATLRAKLSTNGYE